MRRPTIASLSSEMNVTPMLDVLLVLLVIFMASVYQDVLTAMDVARSAGVKIIGIPSSALSPTGRGAPRRVPRERPSAVIGRS